MYMIFGIIRPSVFENWAKMCPKPIFWPLRCLHWPICWRPRPQNNRLQGISHMYPHTKFERPKWKSLWRNCCGGGVTVLNPKYPRLSCIKWWKINELGLAVYLQVQATLCPKVRHMYPCLGFTEFHLCLSFVMYVDKWVTSSPMWD